MAKSAAALSLDGRLFLGRAATELGSLIAKQSEPIFEQMGIVVPVKSCSLLSTLASIEPASAADLAQTMEQSHQLVLQKIPALLGAKLVDKQDDPGDRRRKLFRLTEHGWEQLELLRALTPALTKVYAELYRETGVDLLAALERALGSLREEPLADRFAGMKV